MIAFATPTPPPRPSKGDIVNRCRQYLRDRRLDKERAGHDLVYWAHDYGVDFDLVLATLTRLTRRRQLYIAIISAASGFMLGQLLKQLVLWLAND